jgi:peptide/nickel transport system substrate-binding protein
MRNRCSSRIAPWLAAALLLPALACGDGSQPPDQPVTVRAHLSTDPASLCLIGKTDRSTEILAVQISDSLVQYDPELNLLPRVAESWEISDDRLTVIFHLREGVRWHDGEPVTAEDVVFTVNRVRDPAIENRSWAPLLRDLASVEAQDQRTVVARYEAASPDFLEAWRLPLLPRHLAGRDADLLTGEFARHPVGCGPFRFVRHVPDQEIVLEANDDYWDGRPRIDRLVFKIFPDQSTAYQALLAGELEIVTLTSGLWNEARERDDMDRFEAFSYTMLSVWTVFWNQDGSNPFFTDPRVRRAMVLALDRQSFAASVVHGQARPGITSYHPETIWADPAIGPWPYDPGEASRLLDEAGWRDADRDGVRERAGQPFRFGMMIPASQQRLNDHIAVWLQQSLAEIGVAMEIEKLEWQAFRERRNAARYHAASFSLTFTTSPDQFELYHSSARESGFNSFGLSDPEIDRLCEEGRREFDPEKRREIYHRLQARLHEQEPLTCLFYFSSPVLHDKRLHGVAASPLDYWRTTRGPRLWRWSEVPGPDG